MLDPRLTAAVLVLALLGAAGCPGPGDGDETPSPSEAPAPPTRTDLSFDASDGVTLRGYLTAGGLSPVGAPGVALVHQFMRDDEQWGSLPEDMAKAGYRVLAFNLRGHGDSDPYGGGPLNGLLNDPAGAPLDVQAAIEHLGGEGGADPSRIAVVGTSIGANLAVVAAIRGWAKTHVAFSARIPPTENLAATAAEGMSSVFYLAGENDAGGQAADSQTLFDRTGAPRRIEIRAGSADHGIDLLNDHPESSAGLMEWLSETL
jgi:dienelactone hydrolase